jgi:hypothetical protein
MICFSYLADIRYFPLKNVFRKLLDTVRTGQKWPFWKGGVDGFSYFSLISDILFSNQDYLWILLWKRSSYDFCWVIFFGEHRATDFTSLYGSLASVNCKLQQHFSFNSCVKDNIESISLTSICHYIAIYCQTNCVLTSLMIYCRLSGAIVFLCKPGHWSQPQDKD